MVTAAPGEKYTLRRKVFKILGAAFHIYNADGEVVAYCRQKALKLREDIRVYTGQDMQEELFSMRAAKILDWRSMYRIEVPGGACIGSLRRKGLSSTFVRDAWIVFDEQDREIGSLRAQGSTLAALARRYVENVSLLMPQKFEILRMDGTIVASFRQHFNPFIYRMGIAIHETDEQIDELMVLAAACLVGAIEGRQQ